MLNQSWLFDPYQVCGAVYETETSISLLGLVGVGKLNKVTSGFYCTDRKELPQWVSLFALLMRLFKNVPFLFLESNLK